MHYYTTLLKLDNETMLTVIIGGFRLLSWGQVQKGRRGFFLGGGRSSKPEGPKPKAGMAFLGRGNKPLPTEG